MSGIETLRLYAYQTGDGDGCKVIHDFYGDEDRDCMKRNVSCSECMSVFLHSLADEIEAER